MVEHNLAKVRVASSSLVFRSFFDLMIAQVAELVDAHVSGACVERHAGSSPVLGTLFVRRASFAEIAQLVEHNLAKVRVASSSLVFRSFYILKNKNEKARKYKTYGAFLIFLFLGLFLFQSKTQHHAVVAVCQRADCFKCGIIALAGNQGNQF